MDVKETLVWSVEIPSKNQAALGRRRPRACLVIGDEDIVLLPVAVGKRLDKLKKEGQCFGSRSELLHRVKELSKTCAHDRMESLINFRDYPSKELGQKLLDDGYPESVVDGIVDRALEVGIVNDRRFAESFIRMKVLAGWGKLRIFKELERRGIAEDVLEGLSEELPSAEDEQERAYELACRRRLSGKNDFQKIVRHLVGRGYSVSCASAAARRVLDEGAEER